MTALAPLLFVSHGAPTVATENGAYQESLRRFGIEEPRPGAIVVVSAHWQRTPIAVGGAERPATIHDFGGFPAELYELRYEPPGDPALAAEIRALVAGTDVDCVVDGARGLDHGVWVPLRFTHPDAGIPVVPVALPARSGPAQLMSIGAALAPLRARGVLIVGSGGVVHNLARLRFRGDGPPEPWAKAFDDWVAGRLRDMDVVALRDYRARAPHADLAVPTTEHLDPLFVVLGAAGAGETARTLHEGFTYGSLSMRSFALS